MIIQNFLIPFVQNPSRFIFRLWCPYLFHQSLHLNIFAEEKHQKIVAKSHNQQPADEAYNLVSKL